MDPVLKAGLPKLFVLAALQTPATHTVTECRDGGEKKNIEHFMEKKKKEQIRRTNCHREKRANIRARSRSVKKKTLTQRGEEIGKNGGRNGRGSAGGGSVFGFVL